jgi:hypothetical protein
MAANDTGVCGCDSRAARAWSHVGEGDHNELGDWPVCLASERNCCDRVLNRWVRRMNGYWVVWCCGLVWMGLGSVGTVAAVEPFRLARFRSDATLPLGQRCMGILPTKSTRVLDPLWVHGFVVTGPDAPVVFVAVDWCEIRNASYDMWRERLAQAAGTTRERVIVSSLHQHDAPVVDADAAALLSAVGLRGELFDAEFHERVLSRAADAIRASLPRSETITHVGYAQTPVDRIASNRRVVDRAGRVAFNRGSSSGRDLEFANAEVGLIDDRLRTLSFWNEGRCLLECHAYATHPMSVYGRGEVSSDFVGLARQQRQSEEPETHQIYASGCSGDVTAGKYNDGTPEARMRLIERLVDAMRRSRTELNKLPMTTLIFRCEPLVLEYTREPSLQKEVLVQELNDAKLPVEKRIIAAMGLASHERAVERQQPIDVPCLDLGIAQLVLLPGESFVGYQGIAQAYSPDAPVIPIGYGECWTGYVPTESAIAEGFDESWMWVAPGAEARIRAALKSVLQRN